jgi:hypothetical protein
MDLTRSLENVGNGSFENVHLNNEKTQHGIIIIAKMAMFFKNL